VALRHRVEGHHQRLRPEAPRGPGGAKGDICQRDGACQWAANKAKVHLFTPQTKGQVLAFTVFGSKAFQGDAEARKKLDAQDPAELKKVTMASTTVSKSGQRTELKFKGMHEGKANEAEG